MPQSFIKVLKPAFNEALEEEVDRWTRNYVDVNGLARKLLEAERANRRLREELAKAKKALSKATNHNSSKSSSNETMTPLHPQSPSSPKTKRSKPPRTSRSAHQVRGILPLCMQAGAGFNYTKFGWSFGLRFPTLRKAKNVGVW